MLANHVVEASPEPAVVLRDLGVSFPGQRRGETLVVLDNVSLTVSPAEFVAIVGPSGCGKSTLLNVVGGFQAATRGDVLVQGEPVSGPDPRRLFVFQESAVFPWLTVWENVGFGVRGKGKTEHDRIVRHYVDMVGLTGFEQAYPRQLSGGMRQRAELARALAASPEILYMDEPFGALDYLTRLKMRADLVRIWQAERKTILFVTHDIDEAVQLADRVVVLGPRPATIRAELPIPLSRPRDLNAPGYLDAREQIFDCLGSAKLLGRG